MSRDWTQEELQTASAAMKAAGHMNYEEFCEELRRQEEQTKERVSELLKRNPGVNFSLMTPGGFVDIGADDVKEFLATGKATAHPGCPGADFEVDVSGDGILNQTVVSYTIDGGICHAITDYED